MNKKIIFGIVFMLLLSFTSAFAVLDDADIYYSFDDSNLSGVNPLDLSGNANDGTNSPAMTTGVTGVIDQAFSSTTNTQVGTGVTDSGTFSAAIWYKGDDLSTYGAIAGAFTSSGSRWVFDKGRTTGELVFYVKGTADRVLSDTGYSDDTWYHLIGTNDGTNIKFYINGVLVGSSTIIGTYTANKEIVIGRYTAGTSPAYGDYDEFGYWDGRALTDGGCTLGNTCGGEVAELYNGGAGYNPYAPLPPSAPDTLRVEAKDAGNASNVNNITVLWSGTNYTNATGNVVSINITAEGGNISQLQNFSVYSENYFDLDVTGWNITNNYEANLTQYPYITAHDDYTGSTINTFNATIDATIYQTTNGFIYLPLNTSKTVLIEAANYFSNTTTHNFVSQTNLNASMYQSIINFNVTEIITNNTATGTITIGADTKDSDEAWYLSSGNYTATFVGSGYFDADLVFEVLPLDNKTQNITVSGSIINITATKAYTGDILENFTVSWVGTNISYSGTAVASGSSYSLPALTGYGYNITVSLPGYITKSTVYTTPTNATQANFTLYATNHIVVYFYDEETRAPLLDVNFTLTSSDFGFQGTTSTGTVSFTNLETDKFNLAYTAINYTDRNHIFNIPSVEDSQTNRSLYLLLDSAADDFVLTVKNKLGQTVEGLTASLLRQYVVNNQTVYEVVEMMAPSVALDGATRFTAVPNYVPYLFRVQDSQQNVLFQGSGTTSNNFDTLFLIDSQISIKVDTGTSPFDLSEEIDGFQYSLQNSTTRFWFSYDDTELALESYGLKVYANGTNLVGEATSTNPDSVISVYYTYDNSTSYRAFAYGIDPTTGTQVPIDSIVMERATKPGVAIFGILSWFILFLSLIVFTIGLASNLTIAILFDILAIMAFSSSFIGIIAITLPVQSGLFIAGLVVVYLMRDK